MDHHSCEHPPPNFALLPDVDPDAAMSGENHDRPWLIAQIEQIFEQQVDTVLASDRNLSISLKSRTRRLRQPLSLCSSPGNTVSTDSRTFRFPGRSEQEAWRYTVILRILELVHQALVCDVVITKRDIYYRDPALFCKQTVVDRFVDDLACTFGVPRSLLNVTATAKGLIAGALVIMRTDGTLIDGLSERDGTLISRLSDDDIIDMKNIEWLLVVEKEATFHSLIRSNFWEKALSHGLLVTGKGYPDISTRALLRVLSTPSARNNWKYCPAYGLVDYDPDGLQILSTYKYGSMALAHENATLSLPSIRWLGVKSSDIIARRKEDHHQVQGLLKLTARDRHRAVKMLEREPFTENGAEPEWRTEIHLMLLLNIKAEIQLLEARNDGLQEWLREQGMFRER